MLAAVKLPSGSLMIGSVASDKDNSISIGAYRKGQYFDCMKMPQSGLKHTVWKCFIPGSKATLFK